MSNLMNGTKKTLLAAAAVATLATGATVMPIDSAEAQWRGRHYGGGYGYRGHRGGGRGAAVAAGIIGGIAAGALIAGASRSYASPYQSYGYAPAYQPSYGYAPVYSHGYQPTYYGGASYAYQPTCYTRRVRQRIDYDTVVVRRVRVCE